MATKRHPVADGFISIAPGVQISAQYYQWGALVKYLGTLPAMISAGAITEEMAWSFDDKCKGKQRVDAETNRYSIHRLPTKKEPHRVIVERQIKNRNGGADKAIEWVGVADVWGLTAAVDTLWKDMMTCARGRG